MRTPQRLLALLVAILAVPLHATITGSVMNADGQAIAGAKISVYGPETLSARRERLASKTPDRVGTVHLDNAVSGGEVLPQPGFRAAGRLLPTSFMGRARLVPPR